MKNLLLPELTTDHREGVHKRGVALLVPGGRAGGSSRSREAFRREERHQRAEAEERRGGAPDGSVGPLALGLQAELAAGFRKGDLELPALHKPGEDLGGRQVESGRQERLWLELAVRITDQDPAQRNGWEPRMVPDRSVRHHFERAGAATVPLRHRDRTYAVELRAG